MPLTLETKLEILQYEVRKAAKQFRHYEELHKAKGTTDGHQKAMVNAQFALDCENALRIVEQP